MPLSPDNAEFATRLAEAYQVWADHHPFPDKISIEFIGDPEDRMKFSPRQMAEEIRKQTQFGRRQTEFYLEVSTNQGGPTGEVVVQKFLDWENWWR